jgi:hypothetical protein
MLSGGDLILDAKLLQQVKEIRNIFLYRPRL